MNVRKRTGAMGGPLSTKEPANATEAVENTVSRRGKFHSTNEGAPIDNSITYRPKNVGSYECENAVSKPGKFKY